MLRCSALTPPPAVLNDCSRRWRTRGQPDLGLMDIRLAGGTDGIDAAIRIQAERPVTVVFMPALHDPKTRSRAAADSPADFVPKPFSPRQLLHAVSTACGRSDAADKGLAWRAAHRRPHLGRAHSIHMG